MRESMLTPTLVPAAQLTNAYADGWVSQPILVAGASRVLVTPTLGGTAVTSVELTYEKSADGETWYASSEVDPDTGAVTGPDEVTIAAAQLDRGVPLDVSDCRWLRLRAKFTGGGDTDTTLSVALIGGTL